MADKPALGIKDPYELNEQQYAAALDLLRRQHPLVHRYWHDANVQVQDFTKEGVVVSDSWPFQVNALRAHKLPVASTIPSEGATGWADTTMLHAHARHPNCAYKWLEWSLTPKVQGDVASWFGSLPTVPAACTHNALLGAEGCRTNGVDQFDKIHFWRTPEAGREHGLGIAALHPVVQVAKGHDQIGGSRRRNVVLPRGQCRPQDRAEPCLLLLDPGVPARQASILPIRPRLGQRHGVVAPCRQVRSQDLGPVARSRPEFDHGHRGLQSEEGKFLDRMASGIARHEWRRALRTGEKRAERRIDSGGGTGGAGADRGGGRTQQGDREERGAQALWGLHVNDLAVAIGNRGARTIAPLPGGGILIENAPILQLHEHDPPCTPSS